MISVFDMFSVGIGPSSSHTVGPMRAAKAFCEQLTATHLIAQVDKVTVELFGSLGQTGKGHGTGKAIILGLLGHEPETINSKQINGILNQIHNEQSLNLNNQKVIQFPNQGSITFHRRKSLPQHANALTIHGFSQEQHLISQTYFSIGGGFIIKEEDFEKQKSAALLDNQPTPVFNFSSAKQLLEICKEHGLSISAVMLKNEQVIEPQEKVIKNLWHIWQVMSESVKTGIESEGILPGGLKVTRRAPALHRRLQTEQTNDPMVAMDWVNLFALAVNEENAAGGRVVTAPTNGAAGIIPAVLSYFDKFVKPLDPNTASRFLLTAAAIGILYKKNASISGAEVGCQGEVGVACSMAAGALTEIMGGTVESVENAAEIGMEHNLGLTCDPVGGLVQVPCIERNAMGAIKAINASRLALRGTGQQKVSLDKVIKTMWDTGNDMKSKYKETARGGLAVNIIEC
ncbi:L-serine ammonia-lyase [Paraglaciecola sp. 2405UD69-4]|uniref:L-serine ammonia-lyase n=1 Tax=Paraglaciecola sp. 2405UD69-4 TaxID=3391836 RepID=UPI0039C91AC7